LVYIQSNLLIIPPPLNDFEVFRDTCEKVFSKVAEEEKSESNATIKEGEQE